MAAVTGNNIQLLINDAGEYIVGCEDSFTLSYTSEEIITTTVGSGTGTNREYGRNDWQIDTTGVIFIYASESDATAASKVDPTFFISRVKKRKKVAIKCQLTDGSITKYFVGVGIITNIQYAGQAGNMATFAITIKADGELYESSNAISGDTYDGAQWYTYTATGTAASFTATELVNADKVYFIVKNGVVFPAIVALLNDSSLPLANVGVYLPSGYVAFPLGTPLTSGDQILIAYDPA